MNSNDRRALAIVGHDLRQPLQALILYLSALDKRVQGEEARAILAKAERSAEALSTMLSTLLEYARVEAETLQTDIETVALDDAFHNVAYAFPAADIAATKLAVKADRMLLDVAVRQLVANAMAHGGGKARVAAAAAGDMVEITVSDAGAGIAEPDRERAFDAFVQLDKNAGGLGLGLAIVKRAAQLQHGEVALTTAKGGGARLTLRLPRG